MPTDYSGLDASKLDQTEKRLPHKNFQIVTITFGAANQDLDIQHRLKALDPEMVDYAVLQASGPAIVYHDTSSTRIPWAKGVIRLRSPIANLRARILLTLSSSPSKFEGGGISGLYLADGIQFPATQVPSSNPNTIDDYREDVWTPTLLFGGGSTGLAYSVRTGNYTKIGNLVFAEFRITLSAKGTSTGAASITGLPFTALMNPSAVLDTATGMAGLTKAPFVVISGTTLFPMEHSATSRTQLTDANFTNTSDIRAGIFYRI